MTVQNLNLYVQSPQAFKTHGQEIKYGEWKGVTFYRYHSFLNVVRKISKIMSHMDFLSISIIGLMGTGKTTLAVSIAHELHKDLESKYGVIMNVVYWGEKELLDIDNALNTIQSNTTIILDDITNVHKKVSAKQWANIVSIITKIRHRNQDVKICIIYMFHYDKSFDKFLRGTHFEFITSLDNETIKNYAEKYPRYILDQFSETYRNAIVNLYFGGKNKYYTKDKQKIKQLKKEGKSNYPALYAYRNPFAPALFGDGNRLRMIIFPHRTWLDRNCGICGDGQTHSDTNQTQIVNFMAALESQYGSNAITGLRVFLSQHGINAFSTSTTAARNKISKLVKETNIRPAELKHWLEERR